MANPMEGSKQKINWFSSELKGGPGTTDNAAAEAIVEAKKHGKVGVNPKYKGTPVTTFKGS